MTLQEWITNNQTNNLWVEISTKYPNFTQYLKNKFNNYKIKYSPSVFIDRLFAITCSYSLELNAMEVPQELTLENIGTTITSKNINETVINTDNTESYAGYNVEGDFSKNKSKNTSNISQKDDKYIVNLFSYLSRVNNNIFRQQWRNIEREITRLFIMMWF